jgi:hypothetical protein
MTNEGSGTLHLKVVSLVVALTVFSLVAADRQTTRSYVFDVRLAEAPTGFRLMNELPPVEATVRGPSREFARIDPSALQTIRIENVSPDQGVYRLRASNFNLPTGLEVTDISPPEVALDFEPLEPVDVRVRPVTRGEPSAGFVVEDVRVEPSTVTIQTPNGQWDGSSIPTQPIDIEGITENVQKSVGLKILDYSIDFDESIEVDVFIQISEQRESAELTDQPIQVVGPYRGEYELSHDTVDVRVAGSKEAVSKVREEGILVTLDLSPAIENGSGRYRLEPVVQNIPEDLEVQSVDPSTIVVDLRLPRQPTSSNPPEPEAEDEE